MYESILQQRDQVCEDYLKFYSQNGFYEKNQLPLRINFDPSLSFVTCTIGLYKEQFFKDSGIDDYCVVQKCLRTNTYQSIHGKSELLYTSSLYMIGGFKNSSSDNFVENFNRCVILQAQFLKRWIRKKSSLVITFQKKIIDFLHEATVDVLVKLGIEIIKLDYNDPGLIWSYGMAYVFGIGTRWEIVDDERRYNFGNVILMFHNEKCIGVDFGGSLEVLVQAINRFPHKIYSCFYSNGKFFGSADFSSNDLVKFMDSLITIIEIIYETDMLENSSISINFVIQKYIRALKCLVVLLGINKSNFDIILQDVLTSNSSWNANIVLLTSKLNHLINDTWDIEIIVNNRKRYRSPIRVKKKKLSYLEERAVNYLLLKFN